MPQSNKTKPSTQKGWNEVTFQGQKPKKSEDFLWADYIELKALISVNQEFSLDDLLTDWDKGEDLGEALDLIDPEEVQKELGPDSDESGTQGLSFDDSPTKRNDRLERQYQDYFRHIIFRKAIFDEFYPFEIAESGKLIIVKEEITQKHKFYIFLLLCSNLRYYMNFKTSLTDSFELICLEALRVTMPDIAEVHLFGKGGANRPSKYLGKLIDKVKMLADDLGEKYKAEDSDFETGENADGGLDLIAWVPTGDKEPGKLVVLGQCACSMTEWVAKQHSSSFDTWKTMIDFWAHTTNIIFIPGCFRDTSNKWRNRRKIHSTILIDRVRLIHLLNNKAQLLGGLEGEQVVEGFLQFREE